VMTVSETGLQHRPAMYWFDLRQQFGMPGIALAAIGFFYLLWRWPQRAILLLLLYAANLAFAWNYNVGDAYIFFLPSHYAVALSAGAGIAAITALSRRISSRSVAAAVGAVILVYPAWRGYDTLPAVDRSWDRRAEELLHELTTPPRSFSSAVRPEGTVFGLDTNWQVQNALEYYMRERKPGIAWFTTEQLEWLQEPDRDSRFRQFVTANSEIGRTVVVTERVLDKVHQPRSPGLHPQPHLLEFSERVRSVPPGTPYTLAILRSDVEFSLDTIAFAHAWDWLAPGTAPPTLRHYTVVVGRVGEGPVLVQSQDRPYRVRTRLDPFAFDVRMESWLPTDTIRRAGFGHVVVNHRHVLTLERGISFVAMGPGGGAFYGSGLFAPIARYPIAAASTPVQNP